MQDIESEGLDNWDDIIYVLSTPRQRGYKDDTVLPNLFVTNHDGYRLADHLNPAEPLYIEKQMTRMAILAAYNGPITLYYGDEFGDRAVDNHGWQKTTSRAHPGTSSPSTTNSANLCNTPPTS